MQIGHIPEGIDLPLFLGALAIAGAGGWVNLAQSNYIRDKGYGMGVYLGRITSPLSRRAEVQSEIGLRFDGSEPNLARWRAWCWRANREHLVTFQLMCVGPLTLLVLSASLTAGVMFLYSGLLIWLNLRTFRGPLGPSLLRIAMLSCACAFCGYFSVLTVSAQLAHLLG